MTPSFSRISRISSPKTSVKYLSGYPFWCIKLMFPDTKSQQAVLFRDRQCVMNPAHPDVTRVEPGVNHDVSVSLSGESDYHNDPLMPVSASPLCCNTWPPKHLGNFRSSDQWSLLAGHDSRNHNARSPHLWDGLIIEGISLFSKQLQALKSPRYILWVHRLAPSYWSQWVWFLLTTDVCWVDTVMDPSAVPARDRLEFIIINLNTERREEEKRSGYSELLSATVRGQTGPGPQTGHYLR